MVPGISPSVMLVTGGSRGIGAATARLAAQRGWDVAVNYVTDEAAALRVVADVERAGRRAIPVRGDVSVEQDVAALFAAVDDGLGPIGALTTNAGVVDVAARVDEMSAERLHRMFAINVVGTILCAREAVRRMATSHGGTGGAIVTVSSAASRLGSPRQYVDYAASKGAIDTFTIGLAREVAAEGVRVNAVRPGIIDTEIHASGGQPDRAERLRDTIPMHRPGTADEVAEAIMWLVSPASSYTTGAIVDVSGGR